MSYLYYITTYCSCFIEIEIVEFRIIEMDDLL